MRILRISMILILLVLSLWGLTIMAGPALITKMLTEQSGLGVEINGLTVKPNLSIEAKKIIINEEFEAKFSSIKASWSLLSYGGPKIQIKIGQARFLKGTTIDGLEIDLKYVGEEKPLSLNLSAAGASNSQLGVLKNIVASTQTNWLFSNFEGIEVLIGRLVTSEGGQNDTQVVNERINVSEVSISNHLLDDRSVKKVQFSDLQVSFIDAVVSNANIDFSGTNLDRKAEITVENMTLLGGALSVTELLTVVPYDRELNITGMPIEFTGNRILVLGSKIKMLSGSIDVGKDILIKGKGVTNDLIVELGNQYIGTLPLMKFEFDGEITRISDALNLSYGAVIDFEETPLSVTANFTGQVIGLEKSAICVDFSCHLTNASLSYDLAVINERAFGSIKCVSVCASGAISGTVTTTNTTKFFNNLVSLNVFNPLIVGAAYALILSGEKQSRGHKLVF